MRVEFYVRALQNESYICRTPALLSLPLSSIFPRPSLPPVNRLPRIHPPTQSQGPNSPRRPQTTSSRRITSRPLQRAAVREPLWNLAGPAGAGRVIYDPDQLFRKQKLTRGGLGCSFEVHGFVFLQLSPSPNSSWFFLPASFSSPLGLSSLHFYPPATLSAWIFMISNKNISRSATGVPDCDLENKGSILSTSPTSWNLCFTFETLFIFECRE